MKAREAGGSSWKHFSSSHLSLDLQVGRFGKPAEHPGGWKESTVGLRLSIVGSVALETVSLVHFGSPAQHPGKANCVTGSRGQCCAWQWDCTPSCDFVSPKSSWALLNFTFALACGPLSQSRVGGCVSECTNHALFLVLIRDIRWEACNKQRAPAHFCHTLMHPPQKKKKKGKQHKRTKTAIVWLGWGACGATFHLQIGQIGGFPQRNTSKPRAFFSKEKGREPRGTGPIACFAAICLAVGNISVDELLSFIERGSATFFSSPKAGLRGFFWWSGRLVVVVV